VEVQFTQSTRVLRGLDDIAAYLKISRRTAWRYIQEWAFPAMRGPAGVYISTTSLVDLWVLSVLDSQRNASETDIIVE
jgi:hypothetical protein